MIFGVSLTSVNGLLSLLITVGLALLASGSPLIGPKATAWITLALAVLRAISGFAQGDAAPNASPASPYISKKLMSAICLYAGISMLSLAGMMLLTGCAEVQWLTEGENVLPALLTVVGSLLTSVGALTGNPALGAAATAITNIGNEVKNGLATLQSMVNQYNQEQSTDGKATILGKIEDTIQAVISQLNQLLSTDFGVSPSIISPIIAFAQLIESQLEAWAGLLPLFKNAPGTVLTAPSIVKAVPMTKKQILAAHDIIVKQPTGDKITDTHLQANLKPQSQTETEPTS